MAPANSQSFVSTVARCTFTQRKRVASLLPKSTLTIIYVIFFIITSSSPSNKFTNADTDVTTSLRLQSHRRATASREVVWVLAFPHSAGIYTERLLKSIAQTTAIQKKDNKEFRANPEKFIPEGGFIVVRSHCGGICLSECSPKQYVLPPEQFLNNCIQNARFDGQLLPSLTVDQMKTGHMVHVIRNPFDSVAARYFYEVKVHSDIEDDEWLMKHSRDPAGFRLWCHEMDMRHNESENEFFDEEMNAMLGDVPCHAEFYKWVQWHNNAFEIEERLNLNVHVLHHKDFKKPTGRFVHELLTFLNRQRTGDPLPFSETSYVEFYTMEERQRIARLIEHIASERTWREG